MKKKAAIITITNSGLNYGNRLQNYALQEKLKEYNLDVETILSSNECFNSLVLSKIRRIIKKIVKRDLRRRQFNRFDHLYIRKSPIIRYGKQNEHVFNNRYDLFFAGSDQVWNPNFHFNSEFEFLTFADRNKRYSYSASFGVDFIPKEYTADYSKWISEMKAISVREESGKNIVKELSNKDCAVHIDPTMLINKEKYHEIEEKPKQAIPDQYLLTYFLGIQSEDYKQFIRTIADKLNLELVELSELKDSKYYHIGPQHYLYLFHHASYICTDSFHGTVFSILFEKEFTVFSRKGHDVSMNGRIETLLGKMQLKTRLYGVLDLELCIQKINYEEVNLYLECEKKKAVAYFEEIKQYW